MFNKKRIQVAIVVLTCNAQNLVISCLSSLTQLEFDNFNLKIIVVDNGSKDNTVETILKKYPQVIVIDNKKNYGFAKGINYGLRFAYQQDADWILLFNDDTIVPKDFLVNLVTLAIQNNYRLCGPKIKTQDNKIWSMGGIIDKKRYSGGLIGYGRKDYQDKNQQVDFISGTAMLVQRRVFEKIGFLDEDYFLYYDDLDFCYRAKKADFLSYIVPSAEIIHLETSTIKKNSPSHYYHGAKSHLIFVFKKAPFFIKLRELVRVGKTILELLFEKNAIRKQYELLAIEDFFLGKFGQNTSIKLY